MNREVMLINRKPLRIICAFCVLESLNMTLSVILISSVSLEGFSYLLTSCMVSILESENVNEICGGGIGDPCVHCTYKKTFVGPNISLAWAYSHRFSLLFRFLIAFLPYRFHSETLLLQQSLLLIQI